MQVRHTHAQTGRGMVASAGAHPSSLLGCAFVQSAPAAAATKIDAQEEKVAESKIKSGWGRQLREDEVDEDGRNAHASTHSLSRRSSRSRRSAVRVADGCSRLHLLFFSFDSADTFLTWLVRYPVEVRRRHSSNTSEQRAARAKDPAAQVVTSCSVCFPSPPQRNHPRQSMQS